MSRTYNHTREDSALMPYPECAGTDAERELALMLREARAQLAAVTALLDVAEVADGLLIRALVAGSHDEERAMVEIGRTVSVAEWKRLRAALAALRGGG